MPDIHTDKLHATCEKLLRDHYANVPDEDIHIFTAAIVDTIDYDLEANPSFLDALKSFITDSLATNQMAGVVSLNPHGFGRKSKSTRLSNIRLNRSKLIPLGIALAGTTLGPFALTLGAILAIYELHAMSSCDINEQDASVLWTMWNISKDTDTVPQKDLLDHVNAHRKTHGRDPISQPQLNDSIEALQEIKAIRLNPDNPEIWYITDTIRVKKS